MISFIKTYIPFTKAVIKSEYFAYKSRFMLWALASTVSFVAQLLLWKAIFNNSTEKVINGYSFAEMILYIGISKCVECASFATVEAQVANGIKQGSLVNSLIKPISFKTELLFRAIGQIGGSCFLFLPIYGLAFGIFVKKNNIDTNFLTLNVALGFFYCILAFMLNYYISLIFSCIVFKTFKYRGIYQLKKTMVAFFSGALFPVSFYPAFFRKLIMFFPFVYLRYYPIVIFQGRLSLTEMKTKFIVGIGWLLILSIISNILWRKSIKNLVVFGG